MLSLLLRMVQLEGALHWCRPLRSPKGQLKGWRYPQVAAVLLATAAAPAALVAAASLANEQSAQGYGGASRAPSVVSLAAAWAWMLVQAACSPGHTKVPAQVQHSNSPTRQCSTADAMGVIATTTADRVRAHIP